MTRFALLFLALGSSAACIVGTVPPSDEPPPGVVCEKKATPGEGHHRTGENCYSGGCHTKGSTAPPYLMTAGTVYEKTDRAQTVDGATITITWAGGEAKYRTANDGGKGNFFDYEIAGITFPATVKVSLCPDPEKAMATPLANEADLNCSRMGCHTETLPIYIK